jgi:hypothetical protein
MSGEPYFRVTDLFGDRDGIRWGYGKASSIAHRRLGSCLWTYDILADRARVFTRHGSDDITTSEVDDAELAELARQAVRAWMYAPQWLEAAE